MSISAILLFVVILLVLVVVHEFGHFIVAKLVGMRVDEFAFGFPPRLFGKKIGETTYAVNAIPLGGYVSIFGENGSEEDKKLHGATHNPRAFGNRSWRRRFCLWRRWWILWEK
jgi:regulator of sigma E protease